MVVFPLVSLGKPQNQVGRLLATEVASGAVASAPGDVAVASCHGSRGSQKGGPPFFVFAPTNQYVFGVSKYNLGVKGNRCHG